MHVRLHSSLTLISHGIWGAWDIVLTLILDGLCLLLWHGFPTGLFIILGLYWHLLPQVPYLCGPTFFIHLKFHRLLYSLAPRYIQQVFLLVMLVQQNPIPCYSSFSTNFVVHLCNNICLQKLILTIRKTWVGPNCYLALSLGGSDSFTCSFS